MKKTLLLAVLMVLLASTQLLAVPFLVCDPYPATSPAGVPETFLVVFDGGTPIETPVQTNTDGTVQLHYDLSTLDPGVHTVVVQAKNLWGVSDESVPLSFQKPSGKLGTPGNVKISLK